MSSDLSITIDGPTASGKTTLAMTLSRLLCLAFLDTGLTFRALSLALSRSPLTPSSDWRSIIQHRPILHGSDSAAAVADRHGQILYRGTDVTDQIFAPDLDRGLSAIAADPEWRAEIRRFQQDTVDAHRRIVVVGRDTGVALLPGATLHVLLNANHSVRRERRRAQYRDVRGRSTAVGPATDRDRESAATIRLKSNTLELDTTYLPAQAVARAVARRLEAIVR
jgi:CMP/dCMP kinase